MFTPRPGAPGALSLSLPRTLFSINSSSDPDPQSLELGPHWLHTTWDALLPSCLHLSLALLPPATDTAVAELCLMPLQGSECTQWSGSLQHPPAGVQQDSPQFPNEKGHFSLWVGLTELISLCGHTSYSQLAVPKTELCLPPQTSKWG